jgi:rod shape determining protein RodA
MLTRIFKVDWILLISVFLLLALGLLTLYSISSVKDAKEEMSVFAKQCIFSILGVGVMLFFAFSNYHYLKSFSSVIFFFSLILLLAVLLWGSTVRGTVGWISIGPFNIQPVEIAKIALIIFLASYISKKKMEIGELGRLIVSFLLTALVIFFVLKQPDFGSAIILVSIWIGMTIISGISRKYFLMLLVAVLVIASLSWFFLADYQKNRVKSFISPEFDPRGSGYNVIQSQVAVGSGGIFGKGIGYGSQSQLNFLPEQ